MSLKVRKSSLLDRQPRAWRIRDTFGTCKLSRQQRNCGRLTDWLRGDDGGRDSSPSISSFLPIVLLHCFPALAILLNRLSPLMGLLFSGGSSRVVEFAARNVASVAPEKNAWILYISW